MDRGVFAYVQPDGTWWINNTAFVAAPDGVVVVDTCATERRTRAFLETLAGVTSAPVRLVVNTHHHGDHTHGNWLVPGATVVGHERCREEVLASGTVSELVFPGVDWGEIQVRAPFVTFTDELTVWVDDLRVDLLFVGPAHTTNDVVAWIPERRTLFAGLTASAVGLVLAAPAAVRADPPEVPPHVQRAINIAIDKGARYLRSTHRMPPSTCC